MHAPVLWFFIALYQLDLKLERLEMKFFGIKFFKL